MKTNLNHCPLYTKPTSWLKNRRWRRRIFFNIYTVHWISVPLHLTGIICLIYIRKNKAKGKKPGNNGSLIKGTVQTLNKMHLQQPPFLSLRLGPAFIGLWYSLADLLLIEQPSCRLRKCISIYFMQRYKKILQF